MPITNCHTHIFTTAIVPDGFLPWYVRPFERWLDREGVEDVLKRLARPLGKDVQYLIHKYHTFAAIGRKTSMAEVFDHLCGFYPDDTRFVVLPMDMEFMQAGRVRMGLIEQLDGLAALKRTHGDRILPFVFAHPERRDVADIVKRYVEDHGFEGIKIYPPLGYFPFDERLNPVYSYAENHGLPVISHCSRGGVFFRGRITEAMRRHPITGQRLGGKDNDTFCDNYSDPKNYRDVLEQFPKLKMCLAHFGGEGEWNKYLDSSHDHSTANDNWFSDIRNLMHEFPTLYTDVSYTHSCPRLLPLLRLIMETDVTVSNRVLFGTDYYMTEQEASEREHSIRLRTAMGERIFTMMAGVNPIAFLR